MASTSELIPEPPPEPAVDGKALQQKAWLGAVILAARTVVLQLCVLGGNVVLARVLDPRDFGIFAVVQFALAFFAYLGDAGLGAALVQKRVAPNQRDLSSVFWAQILLALAVVLVVFLSAPYLHLVWHDLPEGSEWLLRALSIELVLTVARVVPSILMERELQFGRLAVLEVIHNIAFYVAAVAFALLGLGVRALVYSVLVQGGVALLAATVMRPWLPSLVMDMKALRPILKFGIPYQLKNIIGFANGAVTPAYAGAALGERALGLISWAQSTAYFPLRLVEVMSRVTFPVLSKMQGHPELFAQTLVRSVQVCATATLFYAGLLFGIGEGVIHVVFGDKWMPALTALWIFAGTITVGFLTPLVASAMDALGRPQVFVRLSIGWTALAWAVVPFTTPRWGMIGFVGGFVVHTIVGNFIVIHYVLKKLTTGHRLWPRVRASIVAAVAVAAAGRAWLLPSVRGPVTLTLVVLALLVVFAAVLALLDRTAFTEAAALLRKKEPAEDR